jgi:diguanylate cyclase (GGDEF)-like protein/PAS domain S-box-containing protein
MSEKDGVNCVSAAPEANKLADIFFEHNVSCVAILDRDYNFVRVNDAFARAFAECNYFDMGPVELRQTFDDAIGGGHRIANFTQTIEFPDESEKNASHWDGTLAPIWDGSDEPEHMLISLVDVTEARRASEALQIATLVYQHSAEAMMVTDAGHRVLAVNNAFARLTGQAASDAVGKHFDMLDLRSLSTLFQQSIRQAIETGNTWQGDLCGKKSSGADLALRLNVNAVCNPNGVVARRISLFSDITEVKRAETVIWQQANFDSLTKLPNRQRFLSRLQQEIDRARSAGAELAVLLIDLDEFKEINDTLGHDKGDVLLIEVARRIAGCVRESVTLARLGGDEFTLILTEAEDLDNLKFIAKGIISRLAAPFRLGVETVFVSASIGIARFPQDGAELEDLQRHADQAMYAAKKAGRNRYCYFTAELQEAAQSRMRLTNDLRCALAENQFEVYYQPIIELRTGQIRKAEALIRWHHPTRGMLGPSEFIPLAEASGLILEIGEWVFKKSAEQMRRVRAMNHPAFQISVNISPAQFRNDSELNNTWLNHLASLVLPAQSMVIEITEGLLLDLSAEVKEKLLACGDAGIQVSLDDFGTGYSSLAYLKKFDIDYLKIDRVFVSNLETDSDDRALCEAIIVMAHKLGLKVIAEGVETKAQCDLLAAAGCDFAQGFLFSRPAPADQFEALLLDRQNWTAMEELAVPAMS